jgi:hypothetical protein
VYKRQTTQDELRIISGHQEETKMKPTGYRPAQRALAVRPVRLADIPVLAKTTAEIATRSAKDSTLVPGRK